MLCRMVFVLPFLRRQLAGQLSHTRLQYEHVCPCCVACMYAYVGVCPISTEAACWAAVYVIYWLHMYILATYVYIGYICTYWLHMYICVSLYLSFREKDGLAYMHATQHIHTYMQHSIYIHTYRHVYLYRICPHACIYTYAYRFTHTYMYIHSKQAC